MDKCRLPYPLQYQHFSPALSWPSPSFLVADDFGFAASAPSAETLVRPSSGNFPEGQPQQSETVHSSAPAVAEDLFLPPPWYNKIRQKVKGFSPNITYRVK